MAHFEVLIVGCGSMGARRAAILRVMGCRVDAFDVDPERAAAVGNPVSETSARKKPYDGVVIATPPEDHVFYASQIVEQGAARTLLVEKPLSTDLGLTETLIDNASRNGIVTMMGQSLRWHRDLFDLRSNVSSGVLGEVVHVSARFGHRLELWGHDDPVGSYVNGALLDAATHELDLVTWLAGADAAWVIGDAWKTGLHDMDHEDVADVILGLTSGVRATVHVDLADVVYRRSVTVVGSMNTARFDWRDDPQMYSRETGAFVGAMDGATRPADWPDLARGRRILELALAARQSEGRLLQV